METTFLFNKKVFSELIEKTITTEYVSSYKITDVSLGRVKPDGRIYIQLSCNAQSLGGTGYWLCSTGYVFFDELSEETRLSLIKEGLFSSDNLIVCDTL